MSITFTAFQNSAWKDKIDLELNAHLEARTGIHVINAQGLYAFYETQLIGGVIFQKHGDILWIDALWIEPKFRRQGVGSKLMEQIIDFARQNTLTCLQLNTYFEEARSFFDACAFENVASIPQWKYGLTCYFMKKTL
ncbi:MAG: uncharacterized protein K0R76_1527 [Alphaproteobacteria bacterium]|jgi:GNAT superfamily N-acetyltransferase|nr:uncharacterized protein [Alphaproteobacteria bacterium]